MPKNFIDFGDTITFYFGHTDPWFYYYNKIYEFDNLKAYQIHLLF